MVQRIVASALVALLVTFGLFYLMQALIALREGRPQGEVTGRVIDFVRLKKDSDLDLKKRRLPKKQKPEEPPPPPDIDMAKAPKPTNQQLGTVGIMGGFDLDLQGGPQLGAAVSDREAVPIVRVAPQYPDRANRRGIEGWVLLGFTITETGGVRDPVVLDAEPGGIFNRSALRAVAKFKFHPKLVDGTPVEQPNQRISIKYELGDD